MKKNGEALRVKVTRGRPKSTEIILLKALREIEEKRGYVKPHDLVEAATPESSPIHNLFEWDDTKAGIRYRLHQARQLINNIEVKMLDKPADAYYSTTVEIESVPVKGYFSTKQVLSDEQIFASVVRDAVREIRHWQNKYKNIKELKDLVDEVGIEKIAVQYS